MNVRLRLYLLAGRRIAEPPAHFLSQTFSRDRATVPYTCDPSLALARERFSNFPDPPSECATMSLRGVSLMSLFPAMIKLEGRKCLVVGAGRIAAAKATALLDHGATVVVISPQAVKRIQTLSRAGRLVWKRRNFAPRQVAGALLVVAATNSSLVNEAVYCACEARGILCNVVDDPKHCHFFYPAVVRRGSLQIAVSTGGRSPALAARLRGELEQLFGPEWSAWVEHVGKMRRHLLEETMPPKQRKQQLLLMSSPQAFRTFVREHAHGGSSKSSKSKTRVRRKEGSDMRRLARSLPK